MSSFTRMSNSEKWFSRPINLKVRTEQRHRTELYWRGLDFDELTNKQTAMHYSRHRLTMSVAYVTAVGVV